MTRLCDGCSRAVTQGEASRSSRSLQASRDSGSRQAGCGTSQRRVGVKGGASLVPDDGSPRRCTPDAAVERKRLRGEQDGRLVVGAEKKKSRRNGCEHASAVRSLVPGLLQNLERTSVFGHKNGAIGRSLESHGLNSISSHLVARILNKEKVSIVCTYTENRVSSVTLKIKLHAKSEIRERYQIILFDNRIRRFRRACS